MEAVLYGDIIKENLENEVIRALQIIEPRLKMIIPVPIAENMTILYGDIGLKSKIPLYNLGDGLSRVLAFLNSIVKCKNGTVLIDELENGIHYTIHPKLWEIFLEFARKFNVQIFATTHSSELASAFNEIALEDSGTHFSYIELIRNIKDNRIAGNVIDADTLLYKLKAGKPYRGE